MTSLNQLVHIRHARGLTQAALGEAARLPQKYISDLERGLRPNQSWHVQAIADALDVDPSMLTAPGLTICTSPSGAVAGIYAGAR